MKCALCNETDGHKPKCPQRIRVAWQTTGSVWETLARELFDAFDNESAYDTNPAWCEMTRKARQALEDGNAYEALQLLRRWIEQKARG